METQTSHSHSRTWWNQTGPVRAVGVLTALFALSAGIYTTWTTQSALALPLTSSLHASVHDGEAAAVASLAGRDAPGALPIDEAAEPPAKVATVAGDPALAQAAAAVIAPSTAVPTTPVSKTTVPMNGAAAAASAPLGVRAAAAVSPPNAPALNQPTTAPPTTTVEPPAVMQSITSASEAIPPMAARASGLFEAMNAQRIALGFAPLRLDPALSDIAYARAADMNERSYFAHVGPAGQTWLTLLNARGIRASGGGENLARVSGDVERSVSVAITNLMESPTHRANVLQSAFTTVGVAALTDARGVTIFVSIFLIR